MKGAVRLIAQRLFHGKGEVDLQFFIGGFTTKFVRVLIAFYNRTKEHGDRQVKIPRRAE